MKNTTKKSIFAAFILIFIITISNPALASVGVSSGASQSTAFGSSSTANTNISTNNTGSSLDKTNPSPLQGVPIVVSETVSNITKNSATLNGSVNPNGVKTTAWFEVSNGVTSTPQIFGEESASAINLTPYNLGNLTSNTDYKFRVIARNSFGTTYGDWVKFTTLNNSPIIVSEQVINITQNSATLNGSVNPNGVKTTAWFEVSNGVTSTPQIFGEESASAINLTPYNLNGLTPKTTYQFRIVANNSGNVLGNPSNNVYGNWVSFTTLSNGNGGGGSGGSYIYVSVTTSGSNNITKNTATLNGSVITHGLNTTAWFEYGTSNDPSAFVQTNHLYVNEGLYSSPFSRNLTGLSSNTIYYFRAVAKDPSGVRYGNILSFRTLKNTIVPTPINNSGNVNKETNSATEQNNSAILPPIGSSEENSFPNENNYDLSANSLFGNGTFIPSTVFGWVLLLAIIFIIVVIIRQIVKTFKKKESKTVSADHVENLPI